MEKIIGRLKVSPVVLGTDVYGTVLSEKDAFAMLDNYTQLGGNTIDTARMYACWEPNGGGKSEETIGKWLKLRGGRDKTIISTKCAHPPIENMSMHRLDRAEILSDVDKSLLALGTDYIDILWLHRDDIGVEVECIIDTLNTLVKQGKIRCFGASNWTAKRMAQANTYAAGSGQEGFVASQIKWSLASTSPTFADDPTLVEMNSEEYPFYDETKLGVFAFASQAKGFFQKYHKSGEQALSDKSKERYWCDQNLERYKKLKEYCENHNLPLASAVISVLTSNTDFNSVAIVGCKTIEQLKESMLGGTIKMDYEYFKKLMGF